MNNELKPRVVKPIMVNMDKALLKIVDDKCRVLAITRTRFIEYSLMETLKKVKN
jgi:hypothetical protein